MRGNDGMVLNRRLFSRLLTGATLLICATAAVCASPEFAVHDGDTVVFYGECITNQRLYTVFTEAYILTRFPQTHVNFVHSGWSGDRVTGGGAGSIDQRLDRVCLWPYRDHHYAGNERRRVSPLRSGYSQSLH